MNPYESGALAGAIVFVAVSLVSAVARYVAGPSKIRPIGIWLVLVPIGINFFGHPVRPMWTTCSVLVGLLVIFWSQRVAHRSQVKR